LLRGPQELVQSLSEWETLYMTKLHGRFADKVRPFGTPRAQGHAGLCAARLAFARPTRSGSTRTRTAERSQRRERAQRAVCLLGALVR
jgi:hypothetical protein